MANMGEVRPVSKRMAVLADPRITAELWLAGEDAMVRQRNRALWQLERKGQNRRQFVVRFADGVEVRAGTHIEDDIVAVAEMIRCARSRYMESVFRADEAERLADLKARYDALPDGERYTTKLEAKPGPWRFVTLAGGIRTRACPTPGVVSVACGNVEMLGVLEPPAPVKPAAPKRDPLARFSDADLWAELERREAENLRAAA